MNEEAKPEAQKRKAETLSALSLVSAFPIFAFRF